MVEDKTPAVAPRAEAPPQGDHPQMGKQGEQTRNKYPRGREMVESQVGGQSRTLGGLRGRELREEPDDQTAGYKPAQCPLGALRREPHPDERRRVVFLIGIHHRCNPEQGYECIQREGEEGKREIAECALNRRRSSNSRMNRCLALNFIYRSYIKSAQIYKIIVTEILQTVFPQK